MNVKKTIILVAVFVVCAFLASGGRVTIQNGQLNVSNDFFAGTGLFYINTSNGHVGINDTNPIATLELGSGNVAAANVGYATGEPLLVAHYDGPRPFETDFTGNPHGHLGQTATTSGGVIFRPGKFGKAVQVAEAVTNLVWNPSFETGNSTWGMTTGSILQNSTKAYIGSYSALVNPGVGDGAFTVVNMTSNLTYTASCYVYPNEGADSIRLIIYDDGTGGAQFADTTVSAGSWTRLNITKTVGNGLLKRFYIESLTGKEFYMDGVQVEYHNYTTPYADGSLGTGHSWYGTAHASNSSRTVAGFSYGLTGNLLPDGPFTIATWVQRGPLMPTLNKCLWKLGGAGTVGLYYDTSNTLRLYQSAWLGSGITASGSDYDWHYVAVTYDSVNKWRVYLDGTLADSSSASLVTANGLYIGNDGGSAQDLNGLIDDLAIFDRALSAEEIYTIYKSNAPVQAEAQPLDITGNGSNIYLASMGGRVGIGTTSLGDIRLSVQGNTTTGIMFLRVGAKDGRISVGDNTKNWSIASGWATAGDFSIIEEGVAGSRLYIKQGGGVGIDTTSPIAKLAIPGGVGAPEQIGIGGGMGTSGNKGGVFLGSNNNYTTTAYYGIQGAPTGYTNDFAIVGSSDSVTTRYLHIGYNTNDDPSSQFNPKVSINTYTGKVGIGNSSPAHNFVIQSGASLSVINAGATQFTASSSRDIKENIKPIKVNGILDRISAIPVNTFDFRNSSCTGTIDQCKNKLGLIAEDFNTVFRRGSDKYIDGNEQTMALWLGLQELNKKVEALENENAQLKSIICLDHPETSLCN